MSLRSRNHDHSLGTVRRSRGQESVDPRLTLTSIADKNLRNPECFGTVEVSHELFFSFYRNLGGTDHHRTPKDWGPNNG